MSKGSFLRYTLLLLTKKFDQAFELERGLSEFPDQRLDRKLLIHGFVANGGIIFHPGRILYAVIE